MNSSYERDLDLNLLRVFVVVAESGSVTGAAARLYLTQPAVSAALRRLTRAVGAPLFVRSGRSLALTARGRALLAHARPHLAGLVEAALSPVVFDLATTDRVVRLGLSDASESWLITPLLGILSERAPRLRLVIVSVQFRTVAASLVAGDVDLAVTVADELPSSVQRATLFDGSFVCLYDPAHARVGRRLTQERYLAHEHVVVSYNGDLRGIIEDYYGVERRVRVSVPTFQAVGAVVQDSALLATVPALVARAIQSLRPRLRTTPVPFDLGGTPMELLWRKAADDDPVISFLRSSITRIAKQVARADSPRSSPAHER